jgi:tetratricopeptide (TPR) repeat protein
VVQFNKSKIPIAALVLCSIIFIACPAYCEETLVFDYETSKSFKEDWAAPALTDYTIRILNVETTLGAMPRDRLNRLISRWPGRSKNSLSFETRDAIRQHTGAKFIIEGSLDNNRGEFQFTGTAINPDNGKVSDLSFTLKKFDIEEAQKQLRQMLKKAIGFKFVAKPAALLGTKYTGAYATYWKGVLLYEGNNADKAMPLFERASAQDPEYIEPALMTGRVLLDKALFSKAAEKFKAIAVRWPSDPRAHFLLGLTYYLQRQNAQARAEFVKASEMDKDNPEYYYQLGLVDKDNFRYTESVQELEKAVRLDSSLFDAWYMLASMYSFSKQESEALDCLERASKWGGGEITVQIRNDNAFDWLHTNRRFQMIVNK